MRPPIVSAALIALVCSLLSACGTSEYCQSVDEHRQDFNTSNRTAEGFHASAALLREVGKLAPAESKDDYEKVAAAYEKVAEVQEQIGISLKEMDDNPDVAKEMSSADLAALESAVKEYNAVVDSRVAITDNIKQECDITLQ